MKAQPTRYAKSGDVHVAYQKFGRGKLNLVIVPGWISNLDCCWDHPSSVAWLERFGEYATVVMFDKRGTGLSDRGKGMPGMDERMDDIRAVMDHAGIEDAALFGLSEGGTLAALFAASHPDRCRALVLHGSLARFEQWIEDQSAFDAFLGYVRDFWGTGSGYLRYAPSMAGDADYQGWWARRERAGASPGAAVVLMNLNRQISIADILPAVQSPTLVIHRRRDMIVNIEGGRELARLIPNAELLELPGDDHLPWVGDDLEMIADRIEEFLTGTKPAPSIDRTLATVLFTDIVGSTELATRIGDGAWSHLMQRYENLVDAELARFRGVKVKSLGDGYLATFDGPARAVYAAQALIERAIELGFEIRTGVHIGEIQTSRDDVSGLAVHIAARVMGEAEASQCIVSRTVRDLAAGSDLRFAERGHKRLKGVSEPVQLFAAMKT
ncbi:adenylate/guanylate cyclase domain-containing protein [Ovoidimarina sediminis]|uniref:adenylate/guanylate cyclase domain-containing protein n=1 Tax=Ovoidimarina sediminis TaxID=3079856 RepID=UPI0029100DE3|nr:adenylate/guanylate cyclase domain-containing protein [Rhodophyticola sp. MJ-SS7]MDU8946353.1 adenylate/guanylate cyclase domain-containing protein [Rhodophyticola sp. MJ-SS7]